MIEDDLRLSRIDTLWSVVEKAHHGSEASICTAQQLLIERYGGAIRRYLLGALRNEEAADEVFQEFSLHLVQGAFKRADPSHGRFRNFVKTSLFHLIVDYQRRARRQAMERPLLLETADARPREDDFAKQEEAFTRSWRDELLARCWIKLSDAERTTGSPYFSVLRFRVDHPDMRSAEMATALAAQLGKPLKAGSVRVMVHRARDMLSDLLLDAVIDSIDNPSLEDAEQELIELGLLDYCRSALARRRGTGHPWGTWQRHPSCPGTAKSGDLEAMFRGGAAEGNG